MTSPRSDAAAVFMAQRQYLLGIAYRMLGSVSEAEDILQDAWLRWQSEERSHVDNARAFLSRIVTRLCLDYLQSARMRRESYVGDWLPEPMPDEAAFFDASPLELAQNLSVSLMLALERLSPLERAVFLLRDVFDVDFPEIASTLGRSEAACRQLAARARQHVRQGPSRFNVSEEEGNAMAVAFLMASREGDLNGLRALLADEVSLVTDGGGKRPAAMRPILGREKVCRFFDGIARKTGFGAPAYRLVRLNGGPGLLTLESDGQIQTTALEVQDGRITAIYVVRNPDKLSHLNW